MSAPFIIRVRHTSAMTRFEFTSNQATWKDLQIKIQEKTKVPPHEQLLSKTPLSNPEFVFPDSPSVTLASLGLKHADILYLAGTEAEQKASSQASKPQAPKEIKPVKQLTSRCQHGPGGACLHCDGAPVVIGDAPGSSVPIKCNHPPSATCIHCSGVTKKKDDAPAAWLCAHPPTVFCPNCVPKLDAEEEKKRRMQCSCDNERGQYCPRCVDKDKAPLIKVDLVPYRRYQEDNKAMCKYRHSEGTVCPFCADPPLPSFLGVSPCPTGSHPPYPQSVCLRCAPPTANITQQPYRHVDVVVVDGNLLREKVYVPWFQACQGKVKGAAILIGKHMDEPDQQRMRGAVRAVTHAAYLPPIEAFTIPTTTPSGSSVPPPSQQSFRFLRDDREKHVISVASKLGLGPIGLVICTPNRQQQKDKEKYAGKIFMTGDEIRMAARLQYRYRFDTNEDSAHAGRSRFATIILEQSDQIEPLSYQVSDICVCLERDGLLTIAPSDNNLIALKKPADKELMPTVMYNKQLVEPGTEFRPDVFIVKTILSTPSANASPEDRPMFAHAEFPSRATEQHLTQYMKRFAHEEYLQKFSDFNLLLHASMTGFISEKALDDICCCLKNKSRGQQQVNLNNRTITELDELFMKKQWI